MPFSVIVALISDRMVSLACNPEAFFCISFNPRPKLVASVSKPFPSSWMFKRSFDFWQAMVTSINFACECLAALVSASLKMVYSSCR